MARAIALHPVKADERAGIQTAINLHHLRRLCQIKPNGQAAADGDFARRGDHPGRQTGAVQRVFHPQNLRARTKGGETKGIIHAKLPLSYTPLYEHAQAAVRERGMRLIYLDNAATSFPKPRCTVQAMADALETSGANPGRAGHRLSLAAGRIIEICRQHIAEMLGEADASRVAFAQNTTDALNMAIHGAVHTGDHVVSTLMEHNSVLRPLSELARSGIITLTLVPPDADGRIHAQEIERALTARTRLVAMTHMSNVLGLEQDVAAAGAVCRRRGVLFLVDAAQTAGHVPLKPGKWGCTMLAMPGHKGLLGPHGTGALWVRNGVTLAPLRQGGTGSASESMFQPRMMPDSLESGTLNLPGIAGLDAGMRFALAHAREAHETTAALCGMMREALQNMTNVRVYTKEGASLLSFNVEGMASQVVAAALDEQNIAVRGGLHCAPGVHRFLGTLNIGAVRVSPGLMNTAAEAKKLIDAVWRIAKG